MQSHGFVGSGVWTGRTTARNPFRFSRSASCSAACREENVTSVMALAVDSRAPLGWAGLMIGLAVAAAILLIAPQTGGSLNPARTFGPYLTLAIFGESVPWSQLGVYLVGPLVGGVAAVLLYEFIAETRVAERRVAEASYTPTPGEDS